MAIAARIYAGRPDSPALKLNRIAAEASLNGLKSPSSTCTPSLPGTGARNGAIGRVRGRCPLGRENGHAVAGRAIQGCPHQASEQPEHCVPGGEYALARGRWLRLG